MSEAAFCQALRATIALARRSIADGAFIDLGGFASDIAALCAAVARLPESARPEVEGELKALLTDLDGLATALTAQNASEQPGEVDAARRRAAQAYGPPPAVAD
jgi:hypothetical protein